MPGAFFFFFSFFEAGADPPERERIVIAPLLFFSHYSIPGRLFSCRENTIKITEVYRHVRGKKGRAESQFPPPPPFPGVFSKGRASTKSDSCEFNLSCPRCSLTSASILQLKDHLQDEHGVDPGDLPEILLGQQGDKTAAGAAAASEVVSDIKAPLCRNVTCVRTSTSIGDRICGLRHTDLSLYLFQRCKVCKKHFANVYRLQRHMISHDESAVLRRFKCADCGKAFKFKHHLKVRGHSLKIRIEIYTPMFLYKHTHTIEFSVCSYCAMYRTLARGFKPNACGEHTCHQRPVLCVHALSKHTHTHVPQ